MDVIAEGAEHNSDANDLYQLGCEYAQGYVFGEPMSPERAIALVGSTQSEARAEAKG
jgi:EAL domain-containing protein (putative c-di-GMP-specific phosphodiesterase class I)